MIIADCYLIAVLVIQTFVCSVMYDSFRIVVEFVVRRDQDSKPVRSWNRRYRPAPPLRYMVHRIVGGAVLLNHHVGGISVQSSQ